MVADEGLDWLNAQEAAEYLAPNVGGISRARGAWLWVCAKVYYMPVRRRPLCTMIRNQPR